MPTAYTPRPLPTLGTDLRTYAQRELRDVGDSIGSILLMLPQDAVAVPAKLVHGMIRKAKSPWRPVAGQTTDRWVIYDQDVPGWKYID